MDIKSFRNHEGDIKSIRNNVDENKLNDSDVKPMVYYQSLSSEKIIKNGKPTYESKVETEYDGKKGNFTVDINGEHFEKEFDKKDLNTFMKNQMKPYSSLKELKKDYGITNRKKKSINKKKNSNNKKSINKKKKNKSINKKKTTKKR